MSEVQAPPVVAVVVASDPGPWLEECLVALVGQDYSNLSTLVLDAGSVEPVAARVASVAPAVYLQRLADNRGFGPSANVALETVEGAVFYLFCHDDVVADPDTVRRLVEEAFRSNAGIVAPKLVACDGEETLLQVGLGVDRFGAPVRRVARGEIDAAQHDAAREVFGAPGACTLVRADLFGALGGFDSRMSMFGEDVDLSWRARLAGARVVVAPSARVRHHEATASRQRPLPEARALQWRHELRAVLKNYGRARRAVVVTELAILSMLEICYFGMIGKRWRVRQVVGAWRWNLAPEQDLRGARAAVAASRRIPDRVVAKLFTRRSLRVTRFMRPLLEDLVLHWSKPARTAVAPSPVLDQPGGSLSRRVPRRRLSRNMAVALFAAVLLLVFGSRALLSGHLPLVGGYLPLPGPVSLITRYLGGTTNAGLQRPGPATPAFAILGVVGLLLGGAMGVVLKIGLVLCVAAGGIGVDRLARRFGSASARLVAVVTYLYLPLVWNDVARGDVQALVAYAAAPFVLGRLAAATGLAPFGRHAVRAMHGRDAPEGRTFAPRRLAVDALGLGVLLAVAGAFAPVVVVTTIVSGCALLVGCALLGATARGARAVLVALLAGAVAVALDFPWSLTFFQPGARWSVVSGAATVPSRAPHLSQLLGFALGPIGRAPLVWGFLAAATFVLFVGRGERFAWAARLWIVALGVVATAWAASQGWLGGGGGASRALVAPAAVCIAMAVGLGAASLGADLRRSGFGWRHLGAMAFGLLSLAGLVPVVGASLGGHWDAPATGYDTVLSWVNASGPTGRSQKILWLGDPRTLPGVGWQIQPGLAAAVSSGGLPDATRLWPSSDPAAATAVLADVVEAESGLTIQLGRLLASDGIRYIAVPSAVAPVLPGVQSADLASAPQVLLDALSAQSDLHQLPSEGGIAVFENGAWAPSRRGLASLRTGGGTPAPLRALGVALALSLWAAIAAERLRRRRREQRTPPGAHRKAHAGSSGPTGDAAQPTTPSPSGADADLVPLGAGVTLGTAGSHR